MPAESAELYLSDAPATLSHRPACHRPTQTLRGRCCPKGCRAPAPTSSLLLDSEELEDQWQRTHTSCTCSADTHTVLLQTTAGWKRGSREFHAWQLVEMVRTYLRNQATP